MSSPLVAQVPQLLNYQGRIVDGGTNFTGTGLFQFALVNGSGAPTYWSNGTGTVSVSVTKGLYAVLLGDTTVTNMAAIPSTVFTNSDVRLRVWFNDGVNGSQQLAPDQRVAAAGYALVAANVDPTADLHSERLSIGSGQTLLGINATISGGADNTATNNYATIGGGLGNVAGGAGAIVGGGVTNMALGLEATIGGGEQNLATGTVATIAGGYNNWAGGFESTIAGGEANGAAGTISFVGGGYDNGATGYGSAVVGGYANLASGTNAVVSGGTSNAASGVIACVGGGYGNIASGYAAAVPGGYLNLASGAYSFAAGAGAVASNFGSFVCADASIAGTLASTANNQLTARFAGGVRFFANSNATVGVALAPGGNAWSATSDRNLKENFSPVDTRALLAKLVTVPVTEWNLIAQPQSIRHIGPMAQDFQAAFGVGEDDRHISSTDADGVAFAAIQGLYQLLQDKQQAITALQQQNAALCRRLADIETKLQKVTELWKHDQVPPQSVINARPNGGN